VADATVVRARGAVGMRSRASGVACLEAVAAPCILNSPLFVHFVHCSMDARRRTRGSASLPPRAASHAGSAGPSH